MEEDWLDRTSFVAIPSTVVGIIAALFSLRKFVRWWRPIRKSTATWDGWSSDQEIGTITNVSAEYQAFVECSVRTAYPIRAELFKDGRRPLTPVRLHSAIWFGAIGFDLMDREPIPLVPN